MSASQMSTTRWRTLYPWSSTRVWRLPWPRSRTSSRKMTMTTSSAWRSWSTTPRAQRDMTPATFWRPTPPPWASGTPRRMTWSPSSRGRRSECSPSPMRNSSRRSRSRRPTPPIRLSWSPTSPVRLRPARSTANPCTSMRPNAPSTSNPAARRRPRLRSR